MKKIIVSVTNDLITDQRVDKVCNTLHLNGFEVVLVGRLLQNKKDLHRAYKTHRIKLIFNKGMLFYTEYNLRLFFYLLFTKKDILLSNDLDTLLPNYLASRLQNKKLVYDSHELFTQVPELVNRPKKQKIWLKLEQKILPKLKNTYTVCQSIADYYNQLYHTNFKVVRNVPLGNENAILSNENLRNNLIKEIDNNIQISKSGKNKTSNHMDKNHLSQVENKDKNIQNLTSNECDLSPFPSERLGLKFILYQGAINIGRGLELMIEAIPFIDNAIFVVVGDGDILERLQQEIITKNLSNRVLFLGRKTPAELKKITPFANLGLSIEEDLGLNYRFALPNKLFDYIHANVPVLVSDLPEMRRVIEEYHIGEVVKSRDPKELAKQINLLLATSKNELPFSSAKSDLNWQKEEKIVLSVFKEL